MKNVALLINKLSANNNPDELDVMIQAEEVEKSLNKLGFISHRIFVDLDLNSLQRTLKRINPDLVFNLVEALDGKAGLIYLVPALLESMKIPFTGSDSFSMMLTSNKIRSKHFFSQRGIPTAEWFSFNDHFIPDKNKYYIVKPVWEDGSVGISDNSVIPGDDERLVQLLKTYGDCYFAEEYIHGREFNISIIGNKGKAEIFPLSEIIFNNYPPDKPHILNYESKWLVSSFEYNNSIRNFEFPDTDTFLLDELKKISQQCWKSFGLKGYARIDFRVDKYNRPFVLEINVNPCISPDSGFIAAAQRAGLEFTDVTEMIVAEALRN